MTTPTALLSAGHGTHDDGGAARHAPAEDLGEPLAPYPGVLDALDRRLAEALGRAGAARRPADRAAVTVLLAGRGSRDPAANAEVHKAARLLWEGRGYAGVETAFVSQAAPDVPAGLERCRLLGARRIVVLPFFVSGGALLERARQQVEGWSAAHPELDVRCADAIGPEQVQEGRRAH